jgi:hypothetical protein
MPIDRMWRYQDQDQFGIALSMESAEGKNDTCWMKMEAAQAKGIQ